MAQNIFRGFLVDSLWKKEMITLADFNFQTYAALLKRGGAQNPKYIREFCLVGISYLRFWSVVHIFFLPAGALPSPADLADVSESRTRDAISRRTTPQENKCFCMCGCMIIISKAYSSALGVCVSAHGVCVFSACLIINSRVCTLVIAASHVDKLEPRCLWTEPAPEIHNGSESQRFLRCCVCVWLCMCVGDVCGRVCEFTKLLCPALSGRPPYGRNALWMTPCHHQLASELRKSL